MTEPETTGWEPVPDDPLRHEWDWYIRKNGKRPEIGPIQYSLDKACKTSAARKNILWRQGIYLPLMRGAKPVVTKRKYTKRVPNLSAETRQAVSELQQEALDESLTEAQEHPEIPLKIPSQKEMVALGVKANIEAIQGLTKREAKLKRLRMRAIKVPPVTDDPLVAEKWTRARLSVLTPHALHILEKDLVLGNEAQQRMAAREIMDRGGFTKGAKDASAGGPTIVLIGPDAVEPPWVRGRTKEVKLLERVANDPGKK